jgi:hypothetical protein
MLNFRISTIVLNTCLAAPTGFIPSSQPHLFCFTESQSRALRHLQAAHRRVSTISFRAIFSGLFGLFSRQPEHCLRVVAEPNVKPQLVTPVSNFCLGQTGSRTRGTLAKPSVWSSEQLCLAWPQISSISLSPFLRLHHDFCSTDASRLQADVLFHYILFDRASH